MPLIRLPLIPTNSLTARLTLLFALASSAVLLALGLVVSSLVEKHFEEQDMELLDGKIEFARGALAKISEERGLNALAQALDDSLAGQAGMSIAVVDGNGSVIFATSGGVFPALLVKEGKDTGMAPRVWESHGIPFRGISAHLPTGLHGAAPMLVAVSLDISHHRMFMQSFSRALWAFVVGAAVLNGFLGWVAVRRGLMSLHAMREKMAAVTAQELHQRLSVEAVPGELAQLVHTLNDMLDRLEDAFKRLSDFSSDIAHELRTPISNLMTQTQVTLSRSRSLEEYRGALESNAEEFERLARMISDMLFLAKSDNGLVTPNTELVDLAAESASLCEYFDVLAADRNIEIAQCGQETVLGDRLMLRRALSNLLSNAIAHTRDGGRVRVSLESLEGEEVESLADSIALRGGTHSFGRDADSGKVPPAVRVSVSNEGDPVSPENLERLFDRFYRVDPSRQRHGEGAGLGLAIVQSIVRAHGGTVGARCHAGLTTFWLLLPVSSAPRDARSSANPG